jgi:rod shape-determining protein MreD
MGLLFAAIGATVVALIEATLAPRYINFGGVVPHPVVVGGAIWTIAAGIDRGIAWAFVGGLVLDSLIGRPLGVSAFSLLVAVGVAALVAQPFPRLRIIAPVVAVPVCSFVSSLLILALSAAARPGTSIVDPIGVLIPGVIYDGLIGLFVGPMAIAMHDRRAASERLDWQ